MCRWPTRTRAAALALLLAARCGGEEPPPLDRLLTRLGLVELRLHRQEQALASQTDAARRTTAARQLADSYADQLIAAADDAEQFAALHGRVQKLIAAVPEAKTAALEVALLQAEYQRAEALVIQWMETPADKAPLSQAAQTLGRTAPLLTRRRSELSAAADKIAESIESLTAAPQRAAAEQEMQRQQALALRAGYFAGWSHYYLGVARQNLTAARSDFAAAKEQFTIVLDVSDDKNYEAVEPDGLGLDSIWRARAAIGLGLSELGLGRSAAAAKVFRWLDQPAVPPALRDQSAYWQVQGMLNAGLLDDAVKLVTAQVAAAGGVASPGKCSLAITAVRGGLALSDQNTKQRQRLIAEGLHGLARLRQFETLDKLIEKHGLEKVLGTEQFTLAWLRGRRQYLSAEKSKADEEFRLAAATLSAALLQPEAKSDLADAGQARYYLGWCQFRLNELAAASRTFHESATGLRSAAPDLALQAAWMNATCLVTLAAKDKTQVTPAIAALQNFQQDFPASEQTRRADLLIARLRQSHASPAEAVRELAAIQPADPNYLSAQYEICQLQHQLWTSAKADAAKAAPLAAELLRSADRFLASADRSSDHQRRLKSALLAIDVLLAAASPDESRIARLLEAGREAAEHIDGREPAAVEFQYRRLQQAQRTGDAAALQATAAAIAAHGVGTPYEVPALVIVARAADAAVVAAGDADRTARQDEAAAVYRRLVALLGESPAALAENKNALAASSKLAQYDEDRERWKPAAERLNRLVAAQPKDRRLLRRAGLAAYQSADYAGATSHWRTLLAGVEPGSEEWLEAKYYQLACLARTDRPAAKKVYDQFRLLYPNVRSAAWKDKFTEFDAL